MKKIIVFLSLLVSSFASANPIYGFPSTLMEKRLEAKLGIKISTLHEKDDFEVIIFDSAQSQMRKFVQEFKNKDFSHKEKKEIRAYFDQHYDKIVILELKPTSSNTTLTELILVNENGEELESKILTYNVVNDGPIKSKKEVINRVLKLTLSRVHAREVKKIVLTKDKELFNKINSEESEIYRKALAAGLLRVSTKVDFNFFLDQFHLDDLLK